VWRQCVANGAWFTDRSSTQLLLLLRVLYDHLPTYLVFLPITDTQLSRSVDLVASSMSRELMMTTSQTGRADDQLTSGQLQADTDSHVMTLNSFY